MYQKTKLNRKDFLFEDQWFANITKLPGTLHQQQFQISDCQQCNIFLFDAIACLYVDSCKFCKIFVGACQSSIFVRNCQYIQLVAITQQFRVRDSSQCTFRLFCQSQPVIQSSYKLYFNCYPNWGYKQLDQQIKNCRIQCWNNNWYDIYDFTSNQFSQFNHYILQNSLSDLFKIQIQTNMLQSNMKLMENLIPLTQGFANNQSIQITIFIVKTNFKPFRKNNLSLIQSKISLLSKQLLQDFLINNHNIELKQKQKYLFIKIKFQQRKQWIQVLNLHLILQISDKKLQQLTQNSIFIGFQDEH